RPIDGPLRVQRAEASQSFVQSLRSNGEDWQQSIVIQPIAGPNHRVTEAVCRNRKVDRKKWRVLRLIEPKFIFIEFTVRSQGAENGFIDYSRQKIIQHHELIMEPNLLLDIRERQTCVLSEKTIVETQEQTLQLRYDRIFVVSRIADKSAAI